MSRFWRTLRSLRGALGGAVLARLGTALLLALAAPALSSLAPVALKFLLDALQPASLPSHVPAALSAAEAPIGFLALYIGAQLLGRLAGESRAFLFGAADQSIGRFLGRTAFGHVMALPMKDHLNRATGATIQTLENGLLGCRLLLQQGLFTLFPGIIEIGLICALVLYFFEPVFLYVFAVCTAAYVAVFADGVRRILKTSRAVSSARVEAGAQLADSLLNVETVKAFCAEQLMTDRYDARLARTQERWRAYYRARLANGALVAVIFAAGTATVSGLALQRVMAGALSVGDFVLINAWMLQILRPLEQVGFGLRDMGQGAAFAERLAVLLRTPREAGAGASAAPARGPPDPVSVCFEKVSFAYTPGRKVLDTVSFEIAPGSSLAIVGPSGSGKSTIVRLLMKFLDPGSGRILIDGCPISELSPAQVRGLIALVPQEAALFDESLAFNIAFLRPDADETEIARVARRVRLDTLLAGSTHATQSQVGERGLKLSGGEKQRVAIARALLRGAPILVADEATSALDSLTEAFITGRDGMISGGATTIIIAHRLTSAACADQIIVLSEGRIVERGTHAELYAAGGLYAKMWRSQIGPQP